MSNIHNDEILENIYDTVYEELIKAGHPPSAAEYVGQILARKIFDEEDVTSLDLFTACKDYCAQNWCSLKKGKDDGKS